MEAVGRSISHIPSQTGLELGSVVTKRLPAPPSYSSDIARRRAARRASNRSDERWQSILIGASNVFRKLGYPQATLEDVAAEVGINRASLYYYVGAKEELLAALLYRPLADMAANARAVAVSDLSASQRLRLILERYVSDMIEMPELLIFTAENVSQLLTGLEGAAITANADAYGKSVVAVIEEGVRTGEFRNDIDPLLLMLYTVGPLNWIHRWYRPDGPNTLEEIGDAFVTLTLDALSPLMPSLRVEPESVINRVDAS